MPKQHAAFLALGSNLGDRAANVLAAARGADVVRVRDVQAAARALRSNPDPP